MKDDGALRRVIGFWGGTALIIGITIGSGIFRKPPTIAGLVHDPIIILALWTAFGVISVCGALTIAELSSMIPRAGGVYVYLRSAYGDSVAFVYGWLELLVAAPAAMGALATVLGEFLLDLVGVAPAPWHIPAIAIVAIALLASANLRGAEVGSGVQSVFTAIKVAALALIIAAIFLFGHGALRNLTTGTGEPLHLSALARAVASVIWTYDGWVAISMIAGEMIAPEKLMKRVIIAGMFVIVALYLGANVAYHYMVPVGEMASYKAAIARIIVSEIAGPAAGAAIVLAISASVFGALNGNILARPRIAYAMARDGLSFGFLGRAHRRWATPHWAIVIQSAVGIILVLCLRDFDKLTTYFVVAEWFSLIFAIAAVFVLRRRLPDAVRPYRTPGYPWVPLLFVIGTSLGLAAIVWGELRERNWSPVWGLLIVLAGFPIYSLWRAAGGGSRPVVDH